MFYFRHNRACRRRMYILKVYIYAKMIGWPILYTQFQRRAYRLYSFIHLVETHPHDHIIIMVMIILNMFLYIRHLTAHQQKWWHFSGIFILFLLWGFNLYWYYLNVSYNFRLSNVTDLSISCLTRASVCYIPILGDTCRLAKQKLALFLFHLTRF